MTEPENQEQSAPEPEEQPGGGAEAEPASAAAAPAGPAAGGLASKPGRTRSLAIAATVGIVLAATAFQNLWNQAGPLLEESSRTTGIYPLVILGGIAGLVALGIVALILRRIGRLLLSRRMTVALLCALALLCLASLAFEQEGEDGLRSAASRHNEVAVAEVFSPVFDEGTAKRAGEKIMILVRTAGLTNLAGSWALYSLLGLLALSSIAGLIWRRPVGAREFGFIAAHVGLLLVLGALAAGSILGEHRAQLQMGLDGIPRPIPGGDADAAFSVIVREIIVDELPREHRVLAWRSGEAIERLKLDGSRPGRTRWRDMEVEVTEFIPRAVAEEIVEDKGVEFNNPAVQVEVLGGKDAKASRKATVYAYYSRPVVFPEDGLGLRYVRTSSDEDALAVCRAAPQGDPEKLIVVSAKGAKLDEVELGYGRDKDGTRLTLAASGVRLRVVKWYSGSRVGGKRMVTQAPPLERFPPAIQFSEVVEEGNGSGQKAKTFWVIGGERPTDPVGLVPEALAGMKFLYNPPRWQPVVVKLVEGPTGQFRLAELVDGKVARIRPIAMGGELALTGEYRLCLKAFLRGAQRTYRPVKPAEGQATEAALKLTVGKGAVRESFWFFPKRSGSREILGANFAVRRARSGLRRVAVKTSVVVDGSTVSTEEVELGSCLRYAGYSLYFTGVEITGVREGRTLGLVSFIASRKPGLWVLYAGMILLALGVPWLLWSRFRQVPDAVEEG